jgi:hypothetical protein
MRGPWRSPRQRIEASVVNILLLTSEFSPANGGIGTYAREIAVAVTQLGGKLQWLRRTMARTT